MCIVFDFVIFLVCVYFVFFFFFSSRRRHTRCSRDWSSDVCSSDLCSASQHLVTLEAEQARVSAGADMIDAETRELGDEMAVAGRAERDCDRRRRSEERRVGKEWRAGEWPESYKKKR